MRERKRTRSIHLSDEELGTLPTSPDRTSLPSSSQSPFKDNSSLIAHDVDEEPALDEEDEDGIDLFGSDMERDYRENERLDRYGTSDIDDDEYETMDPAQRAAVEAELRRRDVLEGRLPAAFLEDQEEFGEADFQVRRRRRRKNQEDGIAMEMEEGDAEADVLLENIHDLKGKSIAEWVAMDRPRTTVKKEFRHFLLTYTDEQNNSVYGERIRTLCELNRESLEVSFLHLEDSNALLAYMVSNSPIEMLAIFDEVAMEVVTMNFETYARIHPAIHVRMTDLPVTLSLRDLREVHLNTLVRVTGVVTRRTGVFPQLKYVKYDCVKCGLTIGPIHQDATKEVKLQSCPQCMSKGPFNLNTEQTVYRNFQKLTIQETPGTVPAGRLPRHREVVLLWDLIDAARPGEEIEIIGVYRHNFDMALNTKHGFPVFTTILEANHLRKKDDEYAALRLTQDDIQKIKQLSKDPNIGRKLIQSMAPSIYGHEDIKTAIALQLFGGVPKNVRNKHRIRGDINVLLLGDPGTAKSQFLKYTEKISHRAVFTTGQGASAVGLTASVRKDPMSREWTLEGGALVLADKGICLIDEFDKMNDADRTSIHEAMEQQSISISKAGIVTTLHARCSILAAANPIRGRYNPQLPFSQNVDLTEPILSRFDVLCVVKDRVDPEADERLAEFVVRSHMRSHPSNTAATMTGSNADDPEASDVPLTSSSFSSSSSLSQCIPQSLLKKYIMYAKEKVHPRLHEMDEDKLSRLYSDLRRESLQTGSIPITVRHLESMIRMAEAHARMHLREYVRSDDIDMAISVMLDSFINAQKYTVMRQLRKVFNKYIRYQHDDDELLLYALNDLVRDAIRVHRYSHGELPSKEVAVSLEAFETKARDLNIHNITSFLDSSFFRKHKFSVRQVASNHNRRCIIKTLD